MTRYWLTPIVALALMAAGATAADASTASPAVTAHQTAAAHTVVPGHPMGWIPGAGPASTNSTAESSNWSGYAVTGANGAFHSVSASWIEPKVTCNGTKYAAFWVGLDGYSSDSVEQTGSDSDCTGSSPTYYGWYEMYPASPVYYSNTVKAGDHFHAYVAFSGTDRYTLFLEDITQGWTHKVSKTSSGDDRSSAEVITEAPSSGSGVLPLANFGTVDYTTAKANGTLMSSQSPVQITMVDSSGNDKDSTSTITSASAFDNTWIRAS
jgi:hypothetical protein